MKIKTQISKLFVCSFAVLSISLLSANFIFAQCGNYFKDGLIQIRKFTNPPISTDMLNDWNGDGRSDIWNFRINPATSWYDVVIYPSKPTGYWDWDNPIVYTMPFANMPGGTFTVRDFDSDGRPDMSNGSQMFRNMGNGSLSLTPGFSDSDGISMRVLAFTDLNGDNLLDIIYSILTIIPGPGATQYTTHLRSQTQNPDGSFSNKTSIIVGDAQNGLNSSNIGVGDFNGDGKIDIVYASYFGSTYKHVVILNRGAGIFEPQTPAASKLRPYSGAIRDFNNDGRDDVASNSPSGNLIIYYGLPNGTFSEQNFTAISAGIPAELNGESFLDFIRFHNDSNSYTVAINHGAGAFSQNTYPTRFGTSQVEWRVEDFSGDGKADLLYGGQLSSKISNLFGEELLYIRENTCQPFGETSFANFDGNNNADVTTWNANSGNWASKNALWGSSADASSRNFQWGNGSLGDVPAPGDFDGDGKTDYSVYRNSTGVWYVYRSSDSSWMTFQFGITGDIAVPNDYDGGGKTDFAIFRPSNGSWYIWFTETQQFLGVQFGLNGDKAVPADYDGDNKTDIAVYRPDTGVWYYLKSSDGGFRAIQWGNSTDKPVPADYDGDGKADLTIYRNGEWWMLRSSNNSVASVLYGTANDIPVPVYRNSVSADMTLYNPTNNTWNYFANRYSPGIPLGGSPQDKPVYLGLPNN